MTASREELIVRAQSGDALALNHLLVACQADARRYALRHCVTSEIDDAVQETLLLVTRYVRSLKTAASFAGWLFTIVRRECSRLSRKMFAHDDLEDDKVAAKLGARPTDELRMELTFALESLPPHYLEMILLRDFEEMTIAEISQRLGVTVPTAKARLRRARELVREYLLGVDGPLIVTGPAGTPP